MTLGKTSWFALGKNDGEEPAYPRLRFMEDKTSPRITQKRDRNRRYPAPKHPLSFKKGFKCKERRKVTLPPP
jgi:hypothetical protein